MTPEELEEAEREADAWERLAEAGAKRVSAVLKEAQLEIPYAPGGDTVLVLRDPAPPVVTKTAAGLHIPQISQQEPEPESEGTLVAAGCAALDSLRDRGFILGDKVQIGRFAGWEKEFELDKKGINKRKILQMTDKDILGSFDLKERLWGKKPTLEVTYDVEEGTHWIRPIL